MIPTFVKTLALSFAGSPSIWNCLMVLVLLFVFILFLQIQGSLRFNVFGKKTA